VRTWYGKVDPHEVAEHNTTYSPASVGEITEAAIQRAQDSGRRRTVISGPHARNHARSCIDMQTPKASGLFQRRSYIRTAVLRTTDKINIRPSVRDEERRRRSVGRRMTRESSLSFHLAG